MNARVVGPAFALLLVSITYAAFQSEPKDIKGLMERGDAWTKGGEWDRAVKDYSEVIRLDPKHVDAFIRRGMAHRSKGSLDNAMKDFNEALCLDPKSTRALLGRGATWAVQQKFDEAIADYSETISLDPMSADGYVQRSYCRQLKGEWKAALTDAAEGVRIAPKAASALYARGGARQGQGDWAEAIADFKSAIRLDEGYVNAFVNLAYLQAACPVAKYRDATEALKNAKRACELTYWRDSFALEAYSAAAAEKGDFAEAVKWQKKVLDDSEHLMRRGMGPRMRLRLYEAKEPWRFPSISQKCED
jgi:tetratricopeptide (TPR) repeat protein